MIGSKIGSYIVEEIIGKGSTGVVYRACHEHLPSVYVAVKFLAPAYCQDREIYTRFVREAQVLAALRSCRNIIAIQDIGEHQEQPYLVMEYQPETLAKRLRQGPLEPEEAIRVAGAVLRAFEAFHAKGIIHRDVKPANIFLRSEDGSVALGDFGIALATSGERLTGVGLTPGTPEYMSPEQVQEGEADARTDLYALGIVMCEMLSGHLPFKAATRNDYYYHQMHTAPTLPTGMDARLSTVIKRALEKDPAQRFQSAAEMRTALEAAPEEPRQSTKATTALEGQFVARHHRNRNVALVTGAVVIGLAAASLVVMRQQGNARPEPRKQTSAPPQSETTLLSRTGAPAGEGFTATIKPSEPRPSAPRPRENEPPAPRSHESNPPISRVYEIKPSAPRSREVKPSVPRPRESEPSVPKPHEEEMRASIDAMHHKIDADINAGDMAEAERDRQKLTQLKQELTSKQKSQ